MRRFPENVCDLYKFHVVFRCSVFSRMYIKIRIKLLMNLAALHVGAALPRLVREAMLRHLIYCPPYSALLSTWTTILHPSNF